MAHSLGLINWSMEGKFKLFLIISLINWNLMNFSGIKGAVKGGVKGKTKSMYGKQTVATVYEGGEKN